MKARLEAWYGGQPAVQGGAAVTPEELSGSPLVEMLAGASVLHQKAIAPLVILLRRR